MSEYDSLERIDNRQLNRTAQERIKLYIMQQGLNAGDLLPTEKELGERLGISRTSIREALRSLEAIGILGAKQGVGRFLREFNYDAILQNLDYNVRMNVRDFREIIEIRIALETSFIAQVTPHVREDTIRALYDIITQMERLVDDGRPEEELIMAHTQFHMKLYENLENTLLLHLIQMFSTVQLKLTQANQYHTSDIGEFTKLHRSIVQAIELRDPSLARERMAHHFKDVVAWSKQYYGSAPEVDAPLTDNQPAEGGDIRNT